MEDNQKNIQFVEYVERRECLYNYTLPEYSRKDITDKAWNEIAQEMNNTVQECREKWKNIRNALSRSLKTPASGSGSSNKKEYYLAKHLKFLIPYMRVKPCTSGNVSIQYKSQDVSDNSNTNNQNIDESINQDIQDTNQTTIQNQNLTDLTKEVVQDKTIISRRVPKRKHTELNAADAAFIEWVKSKNNTNRCNANQYFLNSLLPFIEEMTSKQNRIFRQKVMKLIDDILDGKDQSEENGMSSSPSLMECAGSPIFVFSPVPEENNDK